MLDPLGMFGTLLLGFLECFNDTKSKLPLCSVRILTKRQRRDVGGGKWRLSAQESVAEPGYTVGSVAVSNCFASVAVRTVVQH